MCRELKLPTGEGETGSKLIRRSVGQLLRDRMGEIHYKAFVRPFMGHEEQSTTDIYAVAKPEHLGLVARELEAIIDDIEAIAPGSYRSFTAAQNKRPQLKVVKNG